MLTIFLLISKNFFTLKTLTVSSVLGSLLLVKAIFICDVFDSDLLKVFFIKVIHKSDSKQSDPKKPVI